MPNKGRESEAAVTRIPALLPLSLSRFVTRAPYGILLIATYLTHPFHALLFLSPSPLSRRAGCGSGSAFSPILSATSAVTAQHCPTPDLAEHDNGQFDGQQPQRHSHIRWYRPVGSRQRQAVRFAGSSRVAPGSRIRRTYYSVISAGNISFRVAVDTASSDFWIVSSNCTSAQCKSPPKYPLTYASPSFVTVNNNATTFDVHFADTTCSYLCDRFAAVVSTFS